MADSEDEEKKRRQQIALKQLDYARCRDYNRKQTKERKEKRKKEAESSKYVKEKIKEAKGGLYIFQNIP